MTRTFMGQSFRSGRAAGPRRSSGAAALLLGVALLAGASPGIAQTTGTINGRVVSAETDQPMPSTQVFLVGTGLGTLTGANGQFVIPNITPGSYRLRAERIGSRAIEQEVSVAAGQTQTINFQLRTEALGLDEIVVTGTAVASRKREVGNSVSSIGVAQLQQQPVSVDQVLQGRSPGINVLQNSANIGGAAQIRLRGNVSVTMSNQPIIYIDGIRVRGDGFARNLPPTGSDLRSNNDIAGPLGDINPADIERIEVVKGPAATTLYGTEAAAGVIQIFTKSGHTGKPQWTFEVDQGAQKALPFGPDPSEAPPSDTLGVKLPDGTFLRHAPGYSDAGGSSKYLFIDPWLRTGYRQRYSSSVGGGGQGLRYFVSGTYENNTGVLPNDEEKKTSIRGNFTFSPLPRLEATWNTTYTNHDLWNTPAGNNAEGLTLNAFRRDRNYASDDRREAVDAVLPWELTTNINHLISGGTVTYSPMDNFTHRVTFGLDLTQLENRSLRPFGFKQEPTGILSDRRYVYQTLTADYAGNYNFGLSEAMRMTFSWGGQAVSSEQRETSAYGQNFPGPGQPTVSNAGTTLGFETRQRVVNAGFFLQDLFALHDRYFITAGLRVDGNSAFGQDLGLQAYPKLSASYVLSDEPFFPKNLGQVKLRGAWGQSGRAPGAFDAVKTWNAVGWGGQPAFYPQNIGSPTLGPERTTEIELGSDVSVLNDRVSGEFTWYHRITSDALFKVSQQPSEGLWNAQLSNVGKIKNAGVELALRGQPIRTERFTWEIGGSVATNFSEVLSLGGAAPFSLRNGGDDAGGIGWAVEGQPVPVIRLRCVTNPNEKADPIIQDDCTFGPNLPTHIYGVNTTLNLPAGITVAARGEYQGGNYISDGAAFNAVQRSVIWPGCYDAYRLRDAGKSSELTALQRARCINISSLNEGFFVYPAKFFKVREVSASVPIPARLIPRSTGARLTLSGVNVWKWVTNDFPVFDPETGGNITEDTQVRRILEQVPPPATYTASVRVTF